MKPALVSRYAAAAVVVAALAAGALYAVRGDRYRLYTSEHAAGCWQAVKALSSPTASLRPRRITILRRERGSDPEVVIGYRQDRVFAGLELEARCRYSGGSPEPSAILLNGKPVDPALLGGATAPPG